MVLITLLAGCAKPHAVMVPPPSPAPPKPAPVQKEPLPPPAPSKPPPVRKEPPPPPPVLSPQVGQEEEDRMKKGAQAKIEGTEHIVKQIDEKKLAIEQKETFLTIQSFLSKAKEALSIKDFLRAFTLADKAQVLANELFQTLH